MHPSVITITAPKKLPEQVDIALTASKSESNRALIIRALSSEPFDIYNLAEAKDTQTLIELLESETSILDVGPAGTAFRFLTAYLALTTKTERTLTGTQRMSQRPVGILVDALRELGAKIDYQQQEGFPPLKIYPSLMKGGTIHINGSVSSQFISALMMIAPSLEGGLQLQLQGKVASKPYLEMTRRIMVHFGAKASWEGNCISIKGGEYESKPFTVEADWSAASYWYSIVALSQRNIRLKGLKAESLQGDAVVSRLFEELGVSTTFEDGYVRLTPHSKKLPVHFIADFEDCPDIAQTLAVTCAGWGIKASLSGLHSLRIKETDRIAALQQELVKFNVKTLVEGDTLHLEPSDHWPENPVTIATYEDHRMAMAFAPLALKGTLLHIADPRVVDKSYPLFWEHLAAFGFAC